MKVSLIIPFYKRLDFLNAILSRLPKQTYNNFEVIVAEDNNLPETSQFINEQSTQFNFPILHVNQEDKGFRKNKAMNKAIAISTGELLVFIDGDCIPHPKFIEEYVKAAQENTILWGRRVMLSEELTTQLLTSTEFPSLWQLIRSNSKKIEEGVYSGILNTFRNSDRTFKGCNWGIFKQDFQRVNGFDEQYTKPTVGEDDDVEWRLREIGVQKKSLRNKAIVYHLFHQPNYDQSASLYNAKILVDKQSRKELIARKGLNQY